MSAKTGSFQTSIGLTKRAPDAGDSAQIPSSFLRLFIFLVGRLRRPRPSAGNASRWALRGKPNTKSGFVFIKNLSFGKGLFLAVVLAGFSFSFTSVLALNLSVSQI